MFFDADGGTGSGGGGGNVTTFTQEQVNAILAKEKRDAKTKIEDLTNLNSELATNKQLTEQERDELKSKIAELESSYLSETEKKEREWNSTMTKLNAKLEEVGGAANAWRKRFIDSEIKKQVFANAKDAVNPNQLYDLIGHKVEVVEKDDTLEFKIGDNDIAKHIESMKSDVENYGNLFKTPKKGGTPSGEPGKGGTTSGVENWNKKLFGE
jgi:predicted nuclease with TOPRIM domain